MQQQIHVQKAEITQLSKEVVELQKIAKQQQEKINQLQQKTLLQEKGTKRNNIKIDCLAEENEEKTTSQIVVDLIESTMYLNIKKKTF